jgi:hypothetical protein
MGFVLRVHQPLVSRRQLLAVQEVRRGLSDRRLVRPCSSALAQRDTPRHVIGDTSVLFAVARIYSRARGQREPIARMTHRPPMC